MAESNKVKDSGGESSMEGKRQTTGSGEETAELRAERRFNAQQAIVRGLVEKLERKEEDIRVAREQKKGKVYIADLISGRKRLVDELKDEKAVRDTLLAHMNNAIDDARKADKGKGKEEEVEPLPKRQKTHSVCVEQALQDFWSKLGDAKLAQKALKLAEDTYFLGNENLGSTLYVREHYNKIYQLFDTKGSHAILGTPGIGKTYFLYWLLWKACMEKVPVVILETESETFKFSQEGVLVATEASFFRKDLKDPGSWYLIDGMKPSVVPNCFCVLATSPDRKKWYDFYKQKTYNATVRYMPLFTEKELEECFRACFPDLKGGINGVKERFKKYGGAARPVLDKAVDEKALDMYDAAANDVPPSFDATALLEKSTKNDTIHRVIHMEVMDSDYSKFEYKFASRYYSIKIVERFWASKTKEARDFVRSSATLSHIAQIRGLAFEQLAHGILSGGGTFRIRNLSDGVERTIELAKADLTYFKTLNEVPALLAKKKYACPHDPNLAVFDSAVPGILLQMTVSSTHPIKADKLNNILEVLEKNGSGECWFVFVVPSDKYVGFKTQSYVGKTTTRVKKVVQYVLEVPDTS